jgi:hypothetical protein
LSADDNLTRLSTGFFWGRRDDYPKYTASRTVIDWYQRKACGGIRSSIRPICNCETGLPGAAIQQE